MSVRTARGVRSPLLDLIGKRSEVLARGTRLLLERMDEHESLYQRAGESSAEITPSAGKALFRMAERLSLPRELIDPARFLFAVRTCYALVVKLVTSAAIERTLNVDLSPLDGADRRHFEELEAGLRATRWGVVGFPDTPPWGWYLDVWDSQLQKWLQEIIRRLCEMDFLMPETDPAQGHDLFGTFYICLFPKQVRHALGEHYTPAWLADHVLQQIGYDGTASGRLLDPTCGSGVFLLRALARQRNAAGHRGEINRDWGEIAGMDVNPLAVLAARANYLVALRDRLEPDNPIEPPVYLRDVILQDSVDPEYDFIAGNPPWVAWDYLPDEYRQKTKGAWQRYGLFSLSGNDARHGGGKKDLAMLVLYASADRYLRSGGRLGMVVTQTLFQTRGAGDGFRRFRLGHEGSLLKVLRVDDLVDIQPFDTASNWTATICLEKGVPTSYPVPYVRWSCPANGQADRDSSMPGRMVSQRLEAFPVDPEHPQTPWFVRPEGLDIDINGLTGPSEYTGHLGANSGGANGVYWLNMLGRDGEAIEVENLVKRGKQALPSVRTQVEPDLLYPLVRWSDVGRYQAKPSACLLLAQDPTTRRGIDETLFRQAYPKTYAYLRRFESQLRGRAAYRRYQESAPFYSMYNVGEYTVAPYKVVWRRMDHRVRAAVLEPCEVPLLGRRPSICQETCVMIAAESGDEAHYLAALLNSSIVGFLVQSHSVRGGKGFGSPGMLEYVGIRRFDPENPEHRELACLSRAAHRAAVIGADFRAIEESIDEKAGLLYQITRAEARWLTRFLRSGT